MTEIGILIFSPTHRIGLNFKTLSFIITAALFWKDRPSHARGLKKMNSKDFGAWYGNSMQRWLSWQPILSKIQNENAIATFHLKMENLYPPASPEELSKEQDLTVVKVDGPELPIEGIPTQPAVTIRSILLQQGSEKKEVAHVKIERWLDNEIMDESLLAEAVRFVVDHLEKTKGRFVSHCSAGIGRSGVFLAILEALTQLKKGKPVSLNFIFEIVKTLRSPEQGRNGMVQTIAQYELIFKTLIFLDENFGKQLCALLKRPSGLS